jgi:hypothetical protein
MNASGGRILTVGRAGVVGRGNGVNWNNSTIFLQQVECVGALRKGLYFVAEALKSEPEGLA